MFDRAVSLGAWCQTAFQIERYTGVKTRGLFDWLVTPFDGLMAILEDEGARLVRSVEHVHNGRSVRCREYGVLYHHDFRKDSDGKAIIDNEAIGTCRSKLAYKAGKLFDGLREVEGPTLFIRLGGQALPAIANPHLPEACAVSEVQVRQLLDRLEKVSGPEGFHLVLAYHAALTEMPILADSRVSRFDLGPVEVDHQLEKHRWRGNDAQWDRLFAEFGLRRRQSNVTAQPETRLSDAG